MSSKALPPVIDATYRPLRELGKGAAGVVYEVEHLHTGDRLALKLLRGFDGASDETISRFRREARAASAVKSEHVVRVTDAGTAPELDGAPFIVMELLEGRNLEQVAAQGAVKPGDVVEWLRQVAVGLEKAHGMGVIHRDLKPENLFLTEREDGSPLVKILDFGVAKLEGAGSTNQGSVFGTPLYMSPEQARGETAKIDATADTWALAMVAFRLLFGRPYFSHDVTWRVVARVASEKVLAPSSVGCVASEAFDEWFQKSCAPARAERFQSPAEQASALAQALEGVEEVRAEQPTLDVAPTSGQATSQPSTLEAAPPQPTAGRSRLVVVAVLVALAGLLYFGLRPGPRAPAPSPSEPASASAPPRAVEAPEAAAPAAPSAPVAPPAASSALPAASAPKAPPLRPVPSVKEDPLRERE